MISGQSFAGVVVPTITSETGNAEWQPTVKSTRPRSEPDSAVAETVSIVPCALPFAVSIRKWSKCPFSRLNVDAPAVGKSPPVPSSCVPVQLSLISCLTLAAPSVVPKLLLTACAPSLVKSYPSAKAVDRAS